MTTDRSERDRAVNQIGYVYEMIEGYIYRRRASLPEMSLPLTTASVYKARNIMTRYAGNTM